MSALANNPHVNQKIAGQLAKLGITLESQTSALEILATLPAGIYLDESARIFKLLSRLGEKGYDQKSLHIRTVEETIEVTFSLN